MSGPTGWEILHRDAVVADAHNDLLMAVARQPANDWGGYFRRCWLPALRAGGVNLQILPVFVDQYASAERALRQTLVMIECAHRLAEENSDVVRLCRNELEIHDALGSGLLVLVLALEGMPGIGGDVELLSTMARLGVRVASLTHTGRGAFADGSAEESAGSRLTSDGVRAISAMEELGMLLDVSHLAASGVAHALDIARRPVLATHSAARAVYDHHRNLSDELLRRIAEGGGVVCVNFFPDFLDESDHSLPRLFEHIEHIVGVVGVEHVGLGPDFLRRTVGEIPGAEPADRPWPVIPGLGDPADLPAVTREMVARGWSESDIRQILGGSILTILSGDGAAVA